MDHPLLIKVNAIYLSLLRMRMIMIRASRWQNMSQLYLRTHRSEHLYWQLKQLILIWGLMHESHTLSPMRLSGFFTSTIEADWLPQLGKFSFYFIFFSKNIEYVQNKWMLDVEKYIYLYKKALQCLKLSFSMSRQLRQGSKKKEEIYSRR